MYNITNSLTACLYIVVFFKAEQSAQQLQREPSSLLLLKALLNEMYISNDIYLYILQIGNDIAYNTYVI